MINKDYFTDKKVLVTGGSGSIGSAIVKNLIKKNCNIIRVMSNDENGIYELSEELSTLNFKMNKINKKIKKLSDKMLITGVRYLVGDIRDFNRCISATKKIDIVIHAAAMKHVPLCEYNQDEVKKTNIEGTENLIKASIKNNVKKFLLISTDKVVEPSSVMGKSKLEAERLVLKYQKKQKKTKLAIIRFGNILLSRGSVVHKFIKQVLTGNLITVTSKDVSRFFLTINDATKKILEVLKLTSGGEIFIVTQMHAFKIFDLAEAIKSIFKKKNSILITGLREGEKNYEKLISNYEKIIKIFKKNNLAIATKTKNYSSNLITDSRYVSHLTVSAIKKILMKEKIYKLKKFNL